MHMLYENVLDTLSNTFVIIAQKIKCKMSVLILLWKDEPTDGFAQHFMRIRLSAR